MSKHFISGETWIEAENSIAVQYGFVLSEVDIISELTVDQDIYMSDFDSNDVVRVFTKEYEQLLEFNNHLLTLTAFLGDELEGEEVCPGFLARSALLYLYVKEKDSLLLDYLNKIDEPNAKEKEQHLIAAFAAIGTSAT